MWRWDRLARACRRAGADAELPLESRRVERAGRLGVRGVARARTGRVACRGRGPCAPPGRPRPARGDDARPRRGADAASCPRVGRTSHRARPDRRGLEAAYAGTQGEEPRRPRVAPVRLRAHARDRRRDDARRAGDLRLRRRRRRREARAGGRGRRSPRPPLLTRDRRPPGPARRRLDAGRRVEPHAPRPHDEPAPRAGRGLARGPPGGRGRGCLPRDEPGAGRSTTDGSSFSSGPRSGGRSSAESSVGCSATRPTPASLPSSGARSTRSPGARSGG